MSSSTVINDTALVRLRSVVQTIHADRGKPTQLRRLVELSAVLHSGAGITIDFDASQELGEPMVVSRIPEPRPTLNNLRGLTPRERQVAQLIAEGFSNRDIAARLTISTATVKDHVHRILRKLGLPTRAAVISAIHRGA